MHAIHSGLLALEQELGRRDVGRDHALLNELMCVTARARFDPFDLAVHTVDETRLDGVDVERAALFAALT